MIIVGIGHRRVFRASGWGVSGFWRAAWSEFSRALRGMLPARPAARSSKPAAARAVDVTPRVTTIGGHA